MAFGDIRVCPRCGAVHIEDDQMYEDTNRCPNCGAELVPESAEEE